jgi:hypothetical protein
MLASTLVVLLAASAAFAQPVGGSPAAVQVLFQEQPAGQPNQPAKEAPPPEYQIQLEPPGPERVFRLESEAALRERIRQEARDRKEKEAEFPRDPVLGDGQPYAGRAWPQSFTTIVPHVVCYSPLYFEELNAERYGWDAAIFQPIISSAVFYKDLAMLPYNMGVIHPCSCECSPGYFLPGDPVPYYCYVPPFSFKGAVFEAAVVGGGVAVLP